MKHPSDVQLLDHVARRLPRSESEGIAAHLGACAACQARLASLKAVWEPLGLWSPTLPASDVRESVLARLSTAEQATPRVFPWSAIRVAAAILIAISVGHLAGRLTWRSAPTVASPADEAAAASALQLDVLDNSVANSLVALLDAPPEPEGGPR